MSNLAEKITNRYSDKMKKELIDGIWYMSPGPSVSHHDVATGIYSILRRKLKGKTCKPFIDSLEVHFSENDIFVPDVMVVCSKDIIKPNAIYGAPDLIVEVLSPSSMKHDRITKKNIYEKHGVKEYWIVDTKHKSIEVYLLANGKFVQDNIYTLLTQYEMDGLTEGEKADIIYEFKTSLFDDFTIDIREIFEDID